MPRPVLGLCGLLFLAASAGAQISLPTAVNLALQSDPRVKIAEADLTRAKAILAQTKDAFIPSVTATAGVGRATGAPLSAPVILGVAAQSLVYNFAQPDYIRAAHAGVESAQLALEVARSDVAEDATNSYVALDNALQRRAVQQDALTIANRLVAIEQDRFNAGVDPHIELTQARRTAAQIRLQELLVEDEIADRTTHLAALTGLPRAGWQTVHDSIPTFAKPSAPESPEGPTPSDPKKYEGISAAFATARSRQYTAEGDRRYLLRPQLSFSAQYSRLDDAFTSYDFYYPGFRERVTCNPVCTVNGQLNSFNSLSLGVQLSVPLIDMVHRARARESAADAARALADAQMQQNTFIEGRQRLRRSATELSARADLASLDHDLAQDQLDATLTRLQAAAGATGGTQLSPKDEQNARLAERQRTVDLLNAELQLRAAEVTLLRQEGSLTHWLAATIPGATSAPGNATPTVQPVLPPTTGTTPAAPAPPGGAAPAVPTTGTTPSTLPSAPVSNPAPANPPATPQTQPGAPQTPPATPHL